MLTVHQPSDTDPLPPPDKTTLYFRRCAAVLEAVEAEAAVRGLTPAA
jgi:hypothetical protein